MLEEWTLTRLLESEALCTGVAVGVALYQQKVITAHEQKEPIKVGDTLYYIQDGRERLKEMIGKVCQ